MQRILKARDQIDNDARTPHSKSRSVEHRDRIFTPFPRNICPTVTVRHRGPYVNDDDFWGPDLRGGATGQLPIASTTKRPSQKTVKIIT